MDIGLTKKVENLKNEVRNFILSGKAYNHLKLLQND